MSDVIIKVLKNGPLRVEGKVTMIDPEGNVMAYDKQAFSLCRCGHSSNKPFCDSTHKKIGFQHEGAWTPPVPVTTPEPKPE